MLRHRIRLFGVTSVVMLLFPANAAQPLAAADDAQHEHHEGHVQFSIHSAKDGNWSDPKTWEPSLVPGKGDRVLISRGTRVVYDVESKDVIRMLQIVGTLEFARDRNTELNVGIAKVQNSDTCSESGFACDFLHVNEAGEPEGLPEGQMPALIVGTPDDPIPAQYTAKIRLHYLEGMNKDDAPALACCSARMEIHGSPMSRTWVKLGADAKSEADSVTLSEEVTPPASPLAKGGLKGGWRVGDEVIVTASHGEDGPQTESRLIKAIDGKTITLDKPLKFQHFGEGEFRSEVANLSRNVIVESADPDGVRGHTVYHRFSRGGISYARFAHLGKKDVLGRYSIHYHLVGDTMRGSSVRGVAIVDSHNRWVTIHGTQYLVVRDCIGYQSIGHGFFLEDGTEVYNLLDRNLAIQAVRGRRLPKQVLPFDPNDGAGFWWANGRNTLTRNVACENEQYGYRYDSQKRSNFDSNLPVLMTDGEERIVDIRTLPIFRFDGNESHSEGLYSIAVAGTDGVGPDTRHPHVLRNLKMWQTHYALRAELPTMLVENVHIDDAAYGIYRPWFENHVYRNVHIASTEAEPFNRGLDDRSLQHGKITVDGLTFSRFGYGGQMPLIQISANNASGDAESHFRNVKMLDRQRDDRWPLVNLGGGPRLTPSTEKGVPVYIHDYYGLGQHAKVVSTRAKDLLGDGNQYQQDPPLTGNESVAAKVTNVEFPKLLDPVDDLPPATIITSVQRDGGSLVVRGISHDNGDIVAITVNGQRADIVSSGAGVVDWQITLAEPADGKLVAAATDEAGNKEDHTAHRLTISASRVAGRRGGSNPHIASHRR